MSWLEGWDTSNAGDRPLSGGTWTGLTAGWDDMSVMIDVAKYSDINLSHFMSDLIRFLVNYFYISVWNNNNNISGLI